MEEEQGIPIKKEKELWGKRHETLINGAQKGEGGGR